MVWGEALVKAYYLEDKIANYPRVIIDKEVIDQIGNSEELCEYIRKDFDGQYFLNYLCDCHFCGQKLMNGFEQMKKEVEYKYNEKVTQKFYWHMNFVNSELDSKNEKNDRDFRLSL